MQLPGGVAVSSLGHMLSVQAECHGNTRFFAFLNKNLEESSVLGFDELRIAALRVAKVLGQSCKSGARVILLLPAGRDFVVAIYGCWLAGVVPVPALPPEGVSRKRALPRLRRVIEDCGSHVILSTTGTADALFADEPAFAGACQWLYVEDCEAADPCEMRHVDLDDLALIQYTSGSTSAPKGVALTHRNMLANAATMQRTLELDSSSRGLLWLPPHHDMGLMGGIVEPVFAGFPIYLMTPATFLQKPDRWLTAISRYRITVSGAPDFAYRLAASRREAIGHETPDLSCWRVAFCGAEKVRPRTIETFLEAFEPHGFPSSAFIPCYGLAEATLMVAARRAGEGPPTVTRVDADALADGVLAPIAAEGRSISLVSCGPAAELCEVVIAAPGQTAVLGENVIGEVLCGGLGIASRYWAADGAHQTVLGQTVLGQTVLGQTVLGQAVLGTSVDGREGRFVRTGDMGFLADGELYLTGRLEDLIIINGKNRHPEDLEATLEVGLVDHGVPIGGACVIAVGEHDDEVVACVELTVKGRLDADLLNTAIAASFDVVSRDHGVRLERVLVLQRGSIPRTTSGKVQRKAMRRDLAEQAAKALADSQSAALPDIDAATPVASTDGKPAGLREISQWLSDTVCAKLGVPAGSIAPTRPFTELGLSSVDAVTLTGELGEWLDRDIAATFVFDHPTIEKLAAALVGEPRLQSSIESPVTAGKQIAIIGIGCRTPGAMGVQDFWRVLLEGDHPIGPARSTRPNAAQLDATGHEAGYLDAVDAFDAAFFRVPPDEASLMDPQQRTMLEVSWHALESAGLPPAQLRGRPVGVFVGISNGDYGRLVARSADVSPFVGTGNSLAVAANRLSYWYDFTGPSLAVDTACSSSLAAMHLACRALRSGECELALAGGVNLILGDELTQSFASAGMLSPDNRCHSFTDKANGYVRSEGCAMVVLKPLAAAQRDGDRIYAVIHGGAINQDGQSNGLTAPSADAQARCIRAALADAGVDAGDIGYVEAHGTGTPLGDPVEVRGITSAYGAPSRPQCLVGTIKANIGHLEAAAGVVGLIKTALVLHRGEIPPHAARGDLNPHLAMPAWLSVAPTDGTTRLEGQFAAVSSFGFGGTNVHMVLGPPPKPATDDIVAPGIPMVIRVSGRTPKDRAAVAKTYADVIASGGWPAAVAISRASLCRRERLGCSSWPIATNPDGFVSALRIIASGGQPDGIIETAHGDRLVWICQPLQDPEGFIERFSGVLPLLAERFEAGKGSGPGQTLAVAAHRAMREAFEAVGVLPSEFEGEDALASAPPVLASAQGVVPSASSGPDRAVRIGVGDHDHRAGLAAMALDPAEPLDSVLHCLALADAAGHPVNWRDALRLVDPNAWAMPGRELHLYPFARTRHWFSASAPAVDALVLEWKETIAPLANPGAPPLFVVRDARFWPEERPVSHGLELTEADIPLASIEHAIKHLGRHPDARIAVFVPQFGDEQLPSYLASLVQLGLACSAAASRGRPELRIVTTGACHPSDAMSANHAAVWGLCRTMTNELPELRMRLVDVGHDRSGASLALMRRCLDTGDDGHFCIREGRLLVARVVQEAEATLPAVRGDPDCLVLISGGMGQLGGGIAKALFDRGYRRFALVGRRIRDGASWLRDIEQGGATVRRFALDVADRAAVQSLFHQDLAGEPVIGIVHAAGVLADARLNAQGEPEFARCLAPKATGLLNLLEASRDRELLFVAATSSLSGLFGNPGQAAYAAANAWMDACLAGARSRGVAATSFVLGMVSDGGMPVESLSGANPLGLQPMDAQAAGYEIVRRMGGTSPWVALTVRSETPPDAALVPDWLRALTSDWLAYQQGGARGALRGAIGAGSGDARELLGQWLTETIAKAMHVPATDIPRDKGLIDLGLTSVLILQLRMRLQQEMDIVLDAPAFFDHPTIDQLSAYLAGLIGPAVDRVPQPALPLHDLVGKDGSFSETEALLDAILRPEAIRMAQ